MALQYRGRYAPDMLSDKAIAANVADDGQTGTLYLRVQVVQFESTDFPSPSDYKPGHPDTEASLTIVWQDTLQVEIASLIGRTNGARNTYLDGLLDAWLTNVKPMASAIAPMVLAAQKRPPRAIPA